MAGALAWHRPPATSLAGTLTGGTLESVVIIPGIRGEEVAGQSSVPLDTAARLDPKLLRLLLRIIPIVTSAATKAVLEYFWGLRLVASKATGAVMTTAELGSVFMSDTWGRRADWIYRDMGTVTTTGSVADFAVISGVTQNPGSGFFLDYKVKRTIHENEVLVFHHGWRQVGGAAPDAVFAGSLNVEALFWVPR